MEDFAHVTTLTDTETSRKVLDKLCSKNRKELRIVRMPDSKEDRMRVYVRLDGTDHSEICEGCVCGNVRKKCPCFVKGIKQCSDFISDKEELSEKQMSVILALFPGTKFK